MSEAVLIHGIAAGGDGVGTLPDGRVVFVPRSAPGDQVTLRIRRGAKRFARARIDRILEASPDRVVPPCPHYEGDECGSCQLQHVSAAAQRVMRSRLAGDALRRIGRVETADPPIEPSDREWGYRTRITLTVRRNRRGAPVQIGYRRLNRPDEVFDLTRCPIAREELNQLWARVRTHRALLPRNADRLVLRVDRNGGRHLIVHATGGRAWIRAAELGRALGSDGPPVIIWWHPEGGVARTLFGSPDPFPATVFEQVHPFMGDRVRAYAVSELGNLEGKHVWDLYAGIGETTRLVTRHSAPTVESVELDRRAVELAGALGPHEGVIRHAGRVEDVIARLRPADLAIVNPPRTGLDALVTGFLGGTRVAVLPSLLVYVSCDPATLARDVARLAPAYRLVRVRGFDLFPQTAHLETVATLERR